MGQACASHDLVERDALKAVAIEQAACAVDDASLDGRAMSGGVWHLSLLVSRARKYALEGCKIPAKYPTKYYLEHIFAGCSYAEAGGTQKGTLNLPNRSPQRALRFTKEKLQDGETDFENKDS